MVARCPSFKCGAANERLLGGKGFLWDLLEIRAGSCLLEHRKLKCF